MNAKILNDHGLYKYFVRSLRVLPSSSSIDHDLFAQALNEKKDGQCASLREVDDLSRCSIKPGLLFGVPSPPYTRHHDV
jgi:hypothetical protein